MDATSRSSSKLLHGGLRYLENGELRLVREALRERDAWLERAPELAWPIRLTLPIYRTSRRPRWMVGIGLFAYDRIAGRSILPSARWHSAMTLASRDPALRRDGLVGGYEFSDGQMDDQALGLWVAQQARQLGVRLQEHAEVTSFTPSGSVVVFGRVIQYDWVINVAGPWAAVLLEASGLSSPYRLDLIRGSHLIIDRPASHPYLLEVPSDRRIFFVLPWKEKTLIGTTEVRQEIGEAIRCDENEQRYLLSAYRHYFPDSQSSVIETFAGVRPLLKSTSDPSRASREYAIHRDGRTITVFGGKWTTALALAQKVNRYVQ